MRKSEKIFLGLGQQTSVSSGVAASVSRAKTEVKILNEQVEKGRETDISKKYYIFVPCPGGKGPCQAGSQEGEEDDEEEGVGRALLQVSNRNQQFTFSRSKKT